jgi:hypothetical protein
MVLFGQRIHLHGCHLLYDLFKLSPTGQQLIVAPFLDKGTQNMVLFLIDHFPFVPNVKRLLQCISIFVDHRSS